MHGPVGVVEGFATQRHGIGLSVNVEAGITEISADERKLKQILLNLLTNAVKFTPDGGKIDVSARREGSDVVLTWAESPGATRVVSASQQPGVFGPGDVLDANVTSLTYRHAGAIGSGQTMPFSSWLASMIPPTRRDTPTPYEPTWTGASLPSGPVTLAFIGAEYFVPK